ncbi:Uncharacterised protein [Raoultella planticola]|uniref:Uncharacterized protein n=1 Tax=Raoultella planticola TaxID=575 RepID=A0A485BFR8_RAOPL|nr:Uncharacterised protein [Raoultella planticola]
MTLTGPVNQKGGGAVCYPPNSASQGNQALRRSIPCFFNQTSKIEIAAGVMPEIREA